MGRKLTPCNMTEREQKEAWDEFDDYLTPEEEKQVIENMKHYLFYQTEDRGKRRDCICTRPACGRFIETKADNPSFWRVKHGNTTRCPRCGQLVDMLALGRMRTFGKLNQEKWLRTTICRTGKDGALLLMSGYVKRYFSWDNLRGDFEISWKARTYLKPGKRMQWFRIWLPTDQNICGGYWNWGYKWTENKTIQEPFQPAFYDNYGDSFFVGTDAIDQSALKYCQVENWMMAAYGESVCAETDPLRNVVKYLAAYTRYPALEMAVKLGLNRAVTDLVTDGRKNHAAIDWDATTMQGFLRLNKQDAKTFFYSGGELPVLAAYHTAKKADAVGNMKEFVELLKESHTMLRAEELAKCARNAGCSIRSAVSYINKNVGITDNVLHTWGDYLDMAKQLHFDMTRRDVTMPKDLLDRHDAATETLTYHRKVEEQKKNKEFNKRLRKMYEFSYGNLCIVVPTSTQEIIMEGATLQHCVGGYAARHFNNTVTILFLRHKRKPNTPFCTIEIIPRKKMHDKVVIRQIHGYRNEGYAKGGKQPARPEDKHRWFLDVWKAWVMDGSRRDKNGKPILPEMEKEKLA